ncbi:hypothetical protein HanRHA438_Chr08g0329601 [Helianthus annuus]|nr:hypothetical protein HanRHA438_Chr08g0329601 [Helianthus annuus]
MEWKTRSFSRLLIEKAQFSIGSYKQGLKKRKRVSRRFPFASRGVSLEANRGVSPRQN